MSTTEATIPWNTPLPYLMFMKVKHFGVRKNIEKENGGSLAQTVSRFLAGIVASNIANFCRFFIISNF